MCGRYYRTADKSALQDVFKAVATGAGVAQSNPSRNQIGLDASHHIRVSPRGGKNLLFLTSSFIG